MTFSRYFHSGQRRTLLATAVLLASLPHAGIAQPTAFQTPNLSTAAGTTSVTFNGQVFVNQGLQGVSRVPAASKDFRGDSIGAYSALDILPGSWRKTANGYTGTFYALPDRGPNGIGAVNFSDYPGRVSIYNMSFAPYTGSANLPASVASNQQLTLTPTGGFVFTDFTGKVTTGLDPGTGATAQVTQNGMLFPGSTTGAAAGKIALDAEGLRLLANGSFYVSDEYGANIYYFDASGRLQGAILPPAAIAPRTASGSASFTSITNSATGRRVNQGLEGLALTPDSKKLATLLQSATMQDSTNNQETRTNTRLLIYDIAGSATPTTPVGHYVLQLPVFNQNGNGAVNRTAAQSELLALNDNQFLVLSRDGNGLGTATSNPVYKSVLLVDTTGATNLAGTTFETTTQPISPNGVLDASIKPVSQVEVVNILNTPQLARFGMNLVNTTPTQFTLSEKLEGMALVPVLDESAPQDYFLLVGNDNDFLSTTCAVGGENCAQTVNNDPLILVYRLTLPTYVDAGHLQALEASAPVSLGMQSATARDMIDQGANVVGQHLQNLRHGEAAQSFWLNVNTQRRSEDGPVSKLRGTQFTVGADATINDSLLLGAAASFFDGDTSAKGGFAADHDGYQLMAYGALRDERFFANGALGIGEVQFDAIERPAAYGLSAQGSTESTTALANAEFGYLAPLGGVVAGPVIGARWNKVALDGYTETGASGGNLRYGDLDSDKAAVYFGGELSTALGGARGIVRLTWHDQSAADLLRGTVALNSAQHAMALRNVMIPTQAQSTLALSLTLSEIETGPLSWWLNYNGLHGEDAGRIDQLSAGFRWSF